MPLQAGSPVPTEDEHKSTRLSLRIMVADADRVYVGSNLDDFKLGFSLDEGITHSRDFARVLYRLSDAVADQQPDEAGDLDDPAFQKKLDDSLRLDNPLAYLVELRKNGADLRAKLSKELLEEFQYHGFLLGDPGQEPALTFVEKTPILWELMYEGTQTGLPDWRRFWGFRVPTTHWKGQDRTEEIRLQYGFFSAINDDLSFAGREVLQLAQQLQLRLPHESLSDAFRERITAELRDTQKKNETEIAAWFHDCSEHDWLIRFLQEVAPDPDLRDISKQDMLVTILKDSFHHNLLHFACHCATSDQAEFLTRLDLKVAGEPVSLDASLIASDLKRSFSREDPGPLVFLNACGTGKQSATHEPPGLPVGWIKYQGALAVLVTICPVPDYFAHAFALKFYEYLFEFLAKPGDPDADRRRHVREALLDTRRFFMETYNNPLGLAYVLYAFQDVQVLADFAPAGGTP